jgi:alpha-tubulin suppressor-like RCC1 family protein
MRKASIGLAIACVVIIIIITLLYFPGVLFGTSSFHPPTSPAVQGVLVGSGGHFSTGSDGIRRLSAERVPAGDDYIVISSGFHQLALHSNGSIECWGSNGLFNQCNVPTEEDIIAIAGGSEHSLGLRQNGSIVCWGKSCRDVPTGNDFASISTINKLNLALRSNGTIVAWGSNNSGQEFVPEGNDFIAISAGEYNGIALRSNGSIVCWGAKEYCDVPPGDGYVTISASRNTNLAIAENGELIAWDPFIGWNQYVPSGNNYVAISNSVDGHHLALQADGTIVCWGETGTGVCNISSSSDNIAIAAGSSQSLAITNPRAREILATEWQKTKARVISQSGNKDQLQHPVRTPVYPVKYVMNANLSPIPVTIKAYTVLGSDQLNPLPLSQFDVEKNRSKYTPFKEYTIKNISEAFEEFKTHRLSVSMTYLKNNGPVENADQIIVTNISMMYKEYPTGSGMRVVQPYYCFSGFVEKDGEQSVFLKDYVPATENLVEFDLMKMEYTP